MDAKTLSKQIKKTQKKLIKHIDNEEKTNKYVKKLRRLKRKEEEQLKKIADKLIEEKQEREDIDMNNELKRLQEDMKVIQEERKQEKRQELEKCHRNIVPEEDAHEQIVINPYITSDTIFNNMFNNDEKHMGANKRCITNDYRLFENITRHDIYENYLLHNELKDIEDDTELRVNDIITYYHYNSLIIGCITRFTDKTVWYKPISLIEKHHYYCTYDYGQSEKFYKVDYRNVIGKEKRKSRNSLSHVASHKKVLYFRTRYLH
jgi:hypothetical protein